MKEILAVKEYEKNGEKKKVWIRIGTGFENSNGSFSLLFDTFPVNKDITGIVMCDPKPKDEKRPTGPRKVGGQDFTDAELSPDESVPF